MEKMKTDINMMILFVLVISPLSFILFYFLGSTSKQVNAMVIVALITIIIFLIAENSDKTGLFAYRDGIIYKSKENSTYIKWNEVKILNLKKEHVFNQYNFSLNNESLKISIHIANYASFLFMIKKYAPKDSEIYILADNYAKEFKKKF